LLGENWWATAFKLRNYFDGGSVFGDGDMNEMLFALDEAARVHSCLIYHDESKKVFENVWAHVLLFVPEVASGKLLKELRDLRREYGCEANAFHFANISGKKICKEDGSIVIKRWVECGIEGLRSRGNFYEFLNSTIKYAEILLADGKEVIK